MSFLSDFAELSTEQINELISELGPKSALVKEMQIRGLMSRLKGLPRNLAILLVNPIQADIDKPAKLISDLFIKNRLTDNELLEAGLHIHEGAWRIWQKAKQLYDAHPERKAIRDNLNEVVLGAHYAFEKAEANGIEYSDEEAFQTVMEATSKLEEKMRMKTFFRDQFGIECSGDFGMWIEALTVTKRLYPNDWKQNDRHGRQRKINFAAKLFEEARSINTTPKILMEWKTMDRRKMNPNMVYRRPDGIEIFGDGGYVFRGPDGEPRRGMTIFPGRVVAEGSIPDDIELMRMAALAFE